MKHIYSASKQISAAISPGNTSYFAVPKSLHLNLAVMCYPYVCICVLVHFAWDCCTCILDTESFSSW